MNLDFVIIMIFVVGLSASLSTLLDIMHAVINSESISTLVAIILAFALSTVILLSIVTIPDETIENIAYLTTPIIVGVVLIFIKKRITNKQY